MSETWVKEVCPKCGNLNWIYLSESTVSDPEGCICWSCGHEWVWDEAYIICMYGMPVSQVLEEYSINLIEGFETPG